MDCFLFLSSSLGINNWSQCCRKAIKTMVFSCQATCFHAIPSTSWLVHLSVCLSSGREGQEQKKSEADYLIRIDGELEITEQSFLVNLMFPIVSLNGYPMINYEPLFKMVNFQWPKSNCTDLWTSWCIMRVREPLLEFPKWFIALFIITNNIWIAHFIWK